MMGTSVLAAVFVFGILVFIHEFGHFIAAKMSGMRVDEFAIGFGPKIFGRQYGETLYSIRCIPLGGFTDIAGMDPEENDAGERGYCAKPVWKRLATIVAGPFMNLLLPIPIFFMTFLTVGASIPSTRPELGEILPGRPAAMAGLKKGDVIERLAGREVKSWNDITVIVRENGEAPMKVEYRREGAEMTATLIPIYEKNEKRAMIGVAMPVDTYQPGFFESIGLSITKTTFIMKQMIMGLADIVAGGAAADLAGPIGVAQMAGNVARIGFAALMNFAAMLSLNLGIINLLPIPILDGGHVVALLIEAVRRKPLGPKAIHYTQIAGATVLALIMLFATKNDIVRIFFGG